MDRFSWRLSCSTCEPVDIAAQIKTYELPDDNITTVGSERFRCPEVLFQPSFAQYRDVPFAQFGSDPVNADAAEADSMRMTTDIALISDDSYRVMPPPSNSCCLMESGRSRP